jgi:hypothetical protein
MTYYVLDKYLTPSRYSYYRYSRETIFDVALRLINQTRIAELNNEDEDIFLEFSFIDFYEFRYNEKEVCIDYYKNMIREVIQNNECDLYNNVTLADYEGTRKIINKIAQNDIYYSCYIKTIS